MRVITPSRASVRRLVVISLLSFASVAALLAFAASASRRARHTSSSPTNLSFSNTATKTDRDQNPNAPLAAVITATLTDNVTAATKVAPGGTINYTAVITNSGVNSPADDATNLNYSAPLDVNTTLVAGSVHASPIAFNDTYNWVGNTFLDTSARALPAVTGNDVAVNAPGGTDTFTVTAIAGGATALGGVVTLSSPSGHFSYTPPLNRPTAADGATVQDSFTYTITNSADPTLTSTGTVRINLTGRVFYLQAGAAGDGRSNTPSGSPATMSTNADKSTDIFYIFSNAGSLNGLFTVDAGQQLLGQGVNLVVSSITLFNAAAPTPTTTNTAGNCVSLGGAPGNNTLSGFNIGNCTGGTAIAGSNVGTLAVSTLSINTNGGGLDLTGVSTPTVSVVLGGLTSTGGTKNVNLVGLNGTITLASGALSGASGNAFDVSGGAATISYSGTITNTVAARLVNIANRTGGSVTFSGALSGTVSSTGINLSSNTGSTTNFNGGLTLNGTGSVFSATGGGTLNITGINTIGATTAPTSAAVTITSFTIGGSGVTFQRVSSTGAASGIVLSSTGAGSFTITGNGGSCTSAATCTGGAIQTSTGPGVNLTSTGAVSFTNFDVEGGGDDGIRGSTVNGFAMAGSRVINNGNAVTERGIEITNLYGTSSVTNSNISGNAEDNLWVMNNATAGPALVLTVTGSTFSNTSTSIGNDGIHFRSEGASGNANMTLLVSSSTFNHNRGDHIQVTTDAVSNGIMAARIDGNSFTGDRGTTYGGTDLGGGITINPAGAAQVTFNIVNNGTLATPWTGAVVSAITINNSAVATQTTLLQGNIVNNVIGNPATIDSGSSQGDCISIFSNGNGTTTVKVDNNRLRQYSNLSGINIALRDGTAGTLNATVTNNIVANPGTFSSNGVFVSSGATATDAGLVQLDLLNNTLGGSGGNGSTDFRVRHRFASTVRMPGYTGAATDTAAVVTYLQNRNTGAETGSATVNTTAPVGGQFQNTNPPGSAVPLPPAGPLMFASGGVDAVELASVLELTQGELNYLFAAAIKRWRATGLTAEQLAAMRRIRFEIADLSGPYLGEADGNVIRVDNDAAGTGWFIDPTPLHDEEFGDVVSPTRLYTDICSTPAGHLDLLTALMHELGHDIGLPDTYALLTRDDLMYGYLVKGERRLPRRNEARGVNPGGVTELHFLSLASEERTVTAAKNVATQNGQALSVPKATAEEVALIYQSEAPLSHHAIRRVSKNSSGDQNGPLAGETVTLNAIATFPAAGKSITIKYSATVNTPPLARQVSTQGTVTATGGISVLTDDPEPAGAANPTVTLVDTLMTWNGSTNTDWNTASNWTQPAGGTQYAPGVSNPAVNDVVIPNVGNQPTIGTTDIGIYSLNLANGRTLTITNPRILTLGGSPGGDLTLDGIISGGELRFGTGTHSINNAGGTGSLSSTNVTTVLISSAVTLNHNLQMGALAVQNGGNMNIASRTLSLNAPGAAFTTSGVMVVDSSTVVVFNGSTGAQTAAGITYPSLTINNPAGVTLTGNATVTVLLTLTSGDLDTGANTLTMPAAATSGPATNATDVVGNVLRTGFVSGGSALSFGNPFNTIRINSGTVPAGGINMLIAKNAPTSYPSAVQRSYTITPLGGSGITATVRLHYLDSELNGNTPEANLNLRRFNGTGWAPVIPTASNTGDATNNWLENNAVTAFSEWTFSTFTPTASSGVVNGRIVDANGAPVEGAVVRLSGTQNRKFITDANGFYRFDNVETSGFYTVTPSRVNYTFSPSQQAFSQLGETTEATFSATLASGSNFINPLDTPEYFVRQHYLDFLGREPDEAGFNFWSDQILECGTDTNCSERRRENVSAAYFLSIEFQQTGGLVDGLYRASYGVRPQFAQFIPDTRAVAQGVVVGQDGWQAKLDANKEAFVTAFVNRPAFVGVYGNMDNSLFVDTLISHTGVTFTSGERDALVSGLTTGTMTRAEALRSIAENQRFINAKFNDAFVLMEYFGYLRRDPDESGYQFWLNKLNEFGGNFEQAEMVKAFIVSSEYRGRFPQ